MNNGIPKYNVEEQMQVIEQLVRSKKDLDNDLIIENHKGRILIVEDVDENILQEITEHIIKWNKEDMGAFEATIDYLKMFCSEEHIDKESVAAKAFRPITLKISSYGGSVWDGLGLVDVILNSSTPIIGVAMSKAMSMGAVILSACHIKYSMPNATILLHDGTFGEFNTSNKVFDLSRHVESLHDRMKKIIIENTGITEELYDKHRREEWYIFPEEAKELGFVDGIVGEDVSLDMLF